MSDVPALFPNLNKAFLPTHCLSDFAYCTSALSFQCFPAIEASYVLLAFNTLHDGKSPHISESLVHSQFLLQMSWALIDINSFIAITLHWPMKGLNNSMPDLCHFILLAISTLSVFLALFLPLLSQLPRFQSRKQSPWMLMWTIAVNGLNGAVAITMATSPSTLPLKSSCTGWLLLQPYSLKW